MLQGEWQEALRSKWWGVRVVAVQTLGQWWGASRAPEALAVLKQLAESGGGDWNSWEHRAARTACKAIVTHLKPQDVDWVLDWLLQHVPHADLWPLAGALPAMPVLHALASPARLHVAHTDATQAEKLLHILAATNKNTPGCAPAWEKLARHYIASPVIGMQARQWLEWRLDKLSPSRSG